MTFPRTPELATRVGCLDDTAFGEDDSADAWGLRELARNANRLLARGGLMFRDVGNAAGTTAELQANGAKLSHVWPIWQACLPCPELGLPVPKKPGLTRMRLRARATISSGRKVLLQVATRRRPLTEDPAQAQILEMAGTGSSEVYEANDFEVDVAEGELLSFYALGQTDPDTDPLLNTGLFGGASSGTTNVQGGVFLDLTLGAAWNTTGAEVHRGGHYVVFRSTSADARILWGPCPITEVYRETWATGKGLFFYPPPPADLLGAELAYEIHTLPQMRLHSVACYSVDREL